MSSNPCSPPPRTESGTVGRGAQTYSNQYGGIVRQPGQSLKCQFRLRDCEPRYFQESRLAALVAGGELLADDIRIGTRAHESEFSLPPF
jgi:hypothetical protein